MAQNSKPIRKEKEYRIFRLEVYSSGRRIKIPYHTNEFYLSEEEVFRFACGICIGLLTKYKYPVIKIYDDEADDKLFDVVSLSCC